MRKPDQKPADSQPAELFPEIRGTAEHGPRDDSAAAEAAPAQEFDQRTVAPPPRNDDAEAEDATCAEPQVESLEAHDLEAHDEPATGHQPAKSGLDGPDAGQDETFPTAEADSSEALGVEPSSDSPPALDTVLSDLGEGLARIEAAIEAGFGATEKRETILDALHQENQKHRRNLLLSAMEPLLTGLIQLHDMMVDTLDRAECEPEKFDREKLRADIAFFLDEVIEILARQGIERYADDRGTAFDGYRHEPLKTIPVEDPAENGRIQKVVKKGFARRGEATEGKDGPQEAKPKILRPALVVVGKHVPKPSPTEPTVRNSTENNPNDGGNDSGF